MLRTPGLDKGPGGADWQSAAGWQPAPLGNPECFHLFHYDTQQVTSAHHLIERHRELFLHGVRGPGQGPAGRAIRLQHVQHGGG